MINMWARVIPVVLLLLVLRGSARDDEEEASNSDISTTTDFELSYVIEPFESMNYSVWFSGVHNDGGYVDMNVTTEDFLFGHGSLRVEYSIESLEATEGWGGYVDLGAIEPTRPHICQGATHISLWYKTTIPPTITHPGSRLKLALVLLDDSHCIKSQEKCGESYGEDLENYYFFHYVTIGNNNESKANDWQELRIQLDGSSDLELGSYGIPGNGKFDPRHLRGWRIELSMETNNTIHHKGSNKNTTVSGVGVILFDQFACIGGGELFGAGFYTGNNWTDAVLQGGWIQEYYQSDLSENRSTVIMEDGVLSFNYSVQQVETWGGFNGFTYLAPGSAYYNLSQATHVKLNYRVTEPSSSPGRAHIRLNLADGSDCVEDCHGIDYWVLERWYSFSYILDDDEGKGDDNSAVLALQGSTDPEEDFWLTGWSGIMGNEIFNTSMLKGYTIEFNVDSQGEHNSTVEGAIVFTGLAGAAEVPPPPEEMFYVLEPFESIVNNSGWFSRNGSGYLNLNVTTEDALFGEHALEVEYTIKLTKGSGPDSSYVGFGVIEPDRPHICKGATHLSLWYKVLQPQQPLSGRARLGLVLLDDSNCTRSENCGQAPGDNLENYYSFHHVLDGDGVNDWQEFRIDLADPSVNLFSSSVGIQGNGKLDLARLRGWRIEISMDPDYSVEKGSKSSSSSSSGTILIDQLSCVGGGELFGGGFYTGNNWTDAVVHGGWIVEYYQSEIAENNSSVIMEDGILSFNYTVQQVETWGGFNGFTYLAPGSAYYNLSHASHVKFNYHVSQGQSTPGRAHIRLNLADASDCPRDCHGIDYWVHERWYSFSYILDGDGAAGDNFLALEGSREPETPFWLTGWSGILGNEEFDTHMLKGYTIEFNIDSQGDHNSTVSGGIVFSDMAAVFGHAEQASDEDVGEGAEELQCVVEPNFYFQVDSSVFTRLEFLGSKCCETCASDPSCLYAVSTGRDCYTAPYLNSDSVGLLNTAMLQETTFSFWMNRGGDFCELCECREEDLVVDCRARNLAIVPKTFNPPGSVKWTPRVLDLRGNARLLLLGSGSLAPFAGNLEELWLPYNMSYLGIDSLKDLSALVEIHFEGESPSDGVAGNSMVVGNTIMEPNGIFRDVCCGLGSHVNLSSPNWGLAFCDLKFETPGIDSVYLDYIQYIDSQPSRKITPKSDFMAEASESVEKCAEYCTISQECNYFSYDHRHVNAEHNCLLLLDNGTHAQEICCDEDHYADKEGTLPGWISGYPPRTRHQIDNAAVLVLQKDVVADEANGYEAQYELYLGSAPLRGAVWVEPNLVSSTSNLSVSIWPSRVALYNSNSTVTINVAVFYLDDSDQRATTLVIENLIQSCDEAFATQGSTAVFVEVIPPEVEEIDGANYPVVVTILVVLVLIIGSISFLFYQHSQKRNDSVWKVEKSELVFGDPPEIVGRGTFGLVLLAEYRGTVVAVKRVLPPRVRKQDKQDGVTSMRSGTERDFFSLKLSDGMKSCTSVGMASGGLGSGDGIETAGSESDESVVINPEKAKKSFSRQRSSLSHRKLKKDFVREMRYISKLRHPCITTVMGAVTNIEEPMLVMEYMDHGSLYDLLHNETILLEGESLLQMLRDITQGMRFLHAADPQVIHGDLKAQNILVDSKLRAKVADFGLSQKKRVGATGTPFWMAPELLRNESFNTAASDVYSFGIVLYETYSRKDPYEGESTKKVLCQVADPKINKRPPVPNDCPSQLASLMDDCLVANPDERPTFEELDKRLKRIDANAISMERKSFRTEKTTISLFDIFPKHIAHALRDGKQVEAEHHEMVTIFFSDIVGFTDISATLHPRKVADMLDRLYHKLDILSHAHDIFKVETIGDAYMAVTNLVKKQPNDHVKRIADFSLDAVRAANSTLIDVDDPDKGYVNIRVGFHSGPVVADVVGSRCPRYCLFGDTVNTASRMESNSAKNRILCSKRAADLLRTQNFNHPVIPRGVITVKGKGDMHTYWIKGEGADPLPVADPAMSRGIPSLANDSISENTFAFSSTDFLLDDKIPLHDNSPANGNDDMKVESTKGDFVLDANCSDDELECAELGAGRI